MADIRRLTDQFRVAPQIALEDFADLAAEGYRLVINNRPDGESHDQITSAEAEAAAKAAGLGYVHAPFVGAPSRDAIDAAAAALAAGPGPCLAYCRSGTRSATAWALAEAARGLMSADEIVAHGFSAGYNLSGMKDLLRKLAPG